MSESLLSPYHHHYGLYRYDNVYLPRFPLFSLILSSEVAAQDHSDGLSDSGVESEGSELDYTSLDYSRRHLFGHVEDTKDDV